MFNEVFIEMQGQREVLVEGCTGLLEYGEEKIVLFTGKQKLKITGSALKMDAMASDRVSISGIIRAIEYIV